ncbi:MAG: glutamate--tRNA ligase [Nanoarchaeota archaeon]
MHDIIRKLALQNAVKYGGKVNAGAVIGRLFAEHPEKKGQEIIKLVNQVCNEINKIPFEKQKEELDKYGVVEEVKKKSDVFVLPELKNPKKKVIVRFAPNPNGPLHFGHARQAVLNWLFKEKYKGEFILRFDDTDPKVKPPLKEAYEWIKKDLKWLGIKPDKIVIQSKRLVTYYKYAKELITLGKAYVCRCETEQKRKLLIKGLSCACREESAERQVLEWNKFLNKYKEGHAVVRIKTDLNEKNPAVRDWPALRIIDHPKHALIKNKRIWPLLNFASAIDDMEFGVTHIIRGIDLKVSSERQEYIFKNYSLDYPETIYTGKLNFDGVKSTSEAAELIRTKKISGWDDIQLGTLMALRRRGILAETIVNFMKDAGLNKNEINVSVEKIAAFNRQLLDKKANRYFFVEDPKKITIKNAPAMRVTVPLHPEYKRRGGKIFNTKGDFYINDKLINNKVYRLMHLFNFKNKIFVSEEHDPSLHAQLIHWLPANDKNVKVEVLMPNGKKVEGLGEKSLTNLKEGIVVQFYRFGFCRLDKKEKNKLLFWYSHG